MRFRIAGVGGEAKQLRGACEILRQRLSVDIEQREIVGGLRVAADAGNAEAQYALATFYKEGTGVPKDIEKSVRLLQAAALADLSPEDRAKVEAGARKWLGAK